jgi:hypothetical protein
MHETEQTEGTVTTGVLGEDEGLLTEQDGVDPV